jgi:hypothetical protein
MALIRKMAAAFLVATVLCGTALAGDNLNDWGNVEKLKAGSKVIVSTVRGQVIEGEVRAVTDDSLFLEVQLHFDNWQNVVLNRRDIVEVRQRRSRHLQTLIGGLAGVAVGAAIGAGYDAAHPGTDDPGIGKLTFGLLGGLGGMAAGASIPVKGKKIYVAP